MKKTLLFFLLLFSNIFYAQVSSIIHCAGDNVFDLTSRYDELTKGISPDQTITIKYYSKDTYAINDEYAIADPKHFVFNESSITIHVRINTSGGSSIMNSFLLILNYPLEFAYANVTNPVCGSIRMNMNARGGKIPYQFSLDGVNYRSENVFDDVIPGSYTLYIKDAYGCTVTSTKVIDPVYPLTATGLKIDNNCFNSVDGRIEVIAAGGKLPYTYSINGNDYRASNIFSNLAAGQYNVTVKDAIGCLYTFTTEILNPEILTSVATSTNVSFAGNNDGKITVATSGGMLPYSYLLRSNTGAIIKPYQTSNIFNDLASASYTIESRDAKGCITINPVIVTTPPSVTFDINQPSCINPTGTISVIATGGKSPYLYSIDSDTNYSTSNTFSNLSPGNYLIRVKDSENSIISIVRTILQYTSLKSTVVITKNIDCVSNGSINVIASGGKKPYQYSIDNGSTYTTNTTFNNLSAGTYFVRIKDSLDCTAITNSIVLEQPVPLTATVRSTKIENCSINYNSTITITAIGGQAPYQYSINSTNNYQTSNIYFGAAPGTHIVYVKDANGCIFNTSLVIESPSSLIATAIVTSAPVCGGKDSVTINATGGQSPYTYSFTGGNTYSDTNTNELSPGGYTLFIKDSNGCIATTYITVAPSAVIISTISTITNATSPTSNDGNITIIANGGTAPYVYTLFNSSNVIITPAQLSNTFNNLAPGTYGVIVNDAKGCSSVTALATISAPSGTLLATATISQPSCLNPLGTINITASGGSGIYQYSIDNGLNYNYSNVFTVTQSGNYTITVRDSENAIFTFNLVVLPLDPLHLNATIVSQVSCLENGTIITNVVGGVAPYSYSINGSSFQNSNVFTNLYAGVYTITARDNNGCMETVTIMLTPPIAISASVSVDNQNITVNAIGGAGNYQYSLDGLSYQSSNIFTVENYGTYQIFVRDQNGCFVTVMITLNPPTPLVDGKDLITINFKPGQTLGDLVIEGQNIKWYSNQNPLSGKTTKSTEVTLPLTTVLVDGTTYYASQTINGIESVKRLAVTTKLNGSLSTPDIVMPNFRFYPNPVQHTLTIDNTAAIDEIEILSVSGKSVLVKKINNPHSEIDLSNISTGFYFLKVKAEGKVKTIKIVKK